MPPQGQHKPKKKLQLYGSGAYGAAVLSPDSPPSSITNQKQSCQRPAVRGTSENIPRPTPCDALLAPDRQIESESTMQEAREASGKTGNRQARRLS